VVNLHFETEVRDLLRSFRLDAQRSYLAHSLMAIVAPGKSCVRSGDEYDCAEQKRNGSFHERRTP